MYVEFVGFKKQEEKEQVAKCVCQDDRMDNTVQVQFKSGTEAVTYCSLQATFEVRGCMTVNGFQHKIHKRVSIVCQDQKLYSECN
jgi:hypothetical protein